MKRTLLMKSRDNFNAIIPSDEVVYAIKDLTPKAYQLLIYMYSKGNGWEFSDKELSNDLDVSERMVKVYRKELIEKKYLSIQKGAVDVYFIGRKSVLEFESPEK